MFKAKLDNEKSTDQICQKTHKSKYTNEHHPIVHVQYEKFPNFPHAIILYSICGRGLFISTGQLNGSDLLISSKNEQRLLETEENVHIQLIMINSDTGMAIFKEGVEGLEGASRLNTFLTFQILNTG